jgi:hypothetical protein
LLPPLPLPLLPLLPLLADADLMGGPAPASPTLTQQVFRVVAHLPAVREVAKVRYRWLPTFARRT